MREENKTFRELSETERLDRLSHLAAQGKSLETLPKGMQLKIPEMYYFLTMRSLYAMVRMSAMDKETAKKEKQIVMQTYRNFELVNRIGEFDMQILRRLQQEKEFYSKDGCPKCKRLYDELTGLVSVLPEAVSN